MIPGFRAGVLPVLEATTANLTRNKGGLEAGKTMVRQFSTKSTQSAPRPTAHQLSLVSTARQMQRPSYSILSLGTAASRQPSPMWSGYIQKRGISDQAVKEAVKEKKVTSFFSPELGCDVDLHQTAQCKMTGEQLQNAGKQAAEFLAGFAKGARENDVESVMKTLNPTFLAMPTLHPEIHHGENEVPGATRSIRKYFAEDFFIKNPDLRAKEVIVTGVSSNMVNAMVLWDLKGTEVRQNWGIDVNTDGEGKGKANQLHSSLSPSLQTPH